MMDIMQKQILKLLQKISSQLDEISNAQGDIKGEILLLHREFLKFQECTLKGMEETLAKPSEYLN